MICQVILYICLYIEHIIGFLALGSQLHTSPIFSIPILLERSSSCILPKVGEHMISCQSTLEEACISVKVSVA